VAGFCGSSFRSFGLVVGGQYLFMVPGDRYDMTTPTLVRLCCKSSLYYRPDAEGARFVLPKRVLTLSTFMSALFSIGTEPLCGWDVVRMAERPLGCTTGLSNVRSRFSEPGLRETTRQDISGPSE
jgi:hypothetical protein